MYKFKINFFVINLKYLKKKNFISIIYNFFINFINKKIYLFKLIYFNDR